jgi:hypothetical protein
MENNDRLLSLMKEAVELVLEAQEKRKGHREGKISEAEARHLLSDNEVQFNNVQRQIKEEMGKKDWHGGSRSL